MVNIFLLGDDCGGVGLKICRALSNYGGVIHITDKTFTFHSTGKLCFSVSHWKTLPKIFSPNCVVFLKSSEDAKKIDCTENSDIIIISPDSPVGLNCITYGFSEKCSISLSSTETPCPCVSIQHPFICADGTTAEISEITVETSPDIWESSYELLEVCAVVAACGLCKGGIIQI